MKLASLFSDHMVLQRGAVVPVWGWAAPGDDVSVRFEPGARSENEKQVRTARADEDGRWTVRLAPMRACSIPARLVVESRREGPVQEVKDVLVGEVWLASGQSNMEWTVKDSAGAADEIAAADHPGIRMFTVPRVIRRKPPMDVDGTWAVCSPESVAQFSAVAYFFGRELHRSEGVPVGLLNSSWGGTRVEAWTSREALVSDLLCRKEVEGVETVLRSLDAQKQEQAFAEFAAAPSAWLRRHVVPDPGNEGFGRGWAEPDFDDSAWPAGSMPAPWQRRGIPGNGVVWFRRAVNVPAEWVGRDLLLGIGACDKHDTTYFNGVQVGSTGWETDAPWTVCRTYRVPGRLVRAGQNVIAVRIYSYRNQGGLVGPEHAMKLEPADRIRGGAIPLSGLWRIAVEHDFGVIQGTAGEPAPLPNQNSPYCLFDNMIAPLCPYAVRGVIWYQGESNAGQAYHYRTRFPLLIRDWRRAWAQDSLLFLFVQLPNYDAGAGPEGSSWAELREAQLMALHEPETAMAVTIDIGDREDVHPKNKRDVGRRLALAAQAAVYGGSIEGFSPLYRSHSVEGDAICVRFAHASGGLMTTDGGPPKGFTIAGEDRRFVPADAAIEGDAVVVRSPDVSHPVAVRYAWADNPVCNLCSRAGLPASPFRTDDWPGVTWPS